ncbi:GNAT family N-acetyltransferase [Bacillaceae bacterium S4-13-58]
MLVRFKKNFEKIAMGLLSFMPEEKDVKKLQQTIKEYEENSSWELYLWKEEDILGIIGVRFEEDKVIIQHISVNPSHRNQGIGKKMVEEVKQLFGEKFKIIANQQTDRFINKCENQTKIL